MVDDLGTGSVDARLLEMSSAFKLPWDGETHGRDSDLGHFGRIRHPQYFYPDLIPRRSGTSLWGRGFGGEVGCRRPPNRLNQPQPLYPPFLSSYVHAPLASSPSAMGSEWRSSQKRPESQRTSGSSLRFLASSSFSRLSSLRLLCSCSRVGSRGISYGPSRDEVTARWLES